MLVVLCPHHVTVDHTHLCVPPLSHSRSSPSLPSSPLTSPPLTADQGPVGAPGRRHRHSISGQMSYFKILGAKKLAAGGSTNSLFSTAVISGSSSAPNLRDVIPNSASGSGMCLAVWLVRMRRFLYTFLCDDLFSAIEGCGGVPPIRPLETLHNALSLRQLDAFLEVMTSLPLFRTPASSPPKNPSTPLPATSAQLRLQSPSSSE